MASPWPLVNQNNHKKNPLAVCPTISTTGVRRLFTLSKFLEEEAEAEDVGAAI